MVQVSKVLTVSHGRQCLAKGRSSRIGALRALVLCTVVLGTIAGLSIWAKPALAEENLNVLIDRLGRLERDIQGLSRSVYRDKQAPVVSIDNPTGVVSPQDSAYSARLSVRINQLDEQVRSLTGSMESVSYKIDSLTERLNKLVSDIDYRLSNIEHANRRDTGGPSVSTAPATTGVERAPAYVPGASTQPGVLGTIAATDLNGEAAAPGTDAGVSVPPQTTPAATVVTSAAAPVAVEQPMAPAVVASVLPEGTPKERYRFATQKLFKGDYEGAETAFKEFLKAHGDDPLAGNARYWLGETHYVRKNYLMAAQTFLAGYQSNSKGPKAADSLLKLGMSLGGLGKTREACASLNKLRNEYPEASAPIKKVAARERSRFGCK